MVIILIEAQKHVAFMEDTIMKQYQVKYTGTNDYIFKTIFKHPDILSNYLKLLGLDIHPEDIIYENVESQQDISFKAVRFDIRIKTAHTYIDIEGQRYKITGKDKEEKEIDSKSYQDRRKIHYLSVLHSKAYEKGEGYLERRKSIVIFFLDYDIEGKEYIQRTKLVNLETKEIYEDVEIIEIALKKIKGDATLEERMLRVLTREDLTEYYEEEGTVGGVAKMIYELNAEEHAKNVARYEEDMRRHESDMLTAKYNDGFFTGKEEGERKNALATARKLKEMGSTIEFISEATGLSLEHVKELK